MTEDKSKPYEIGRNLIIEKQSQAEKIESVLQVTKGILGEKEKLAKFEEPLIQLMRRTGKLEWFHKATEGAFSFDHTNGGKRTVQIDRGNLWRGEYANENVEMYIIHEDYPTSFPENPIVTGQMIENLIDKTQHDTASLKTRELRAKGDLVYKVALAITVIVGGVIVTGKLVG